MLLPEKFHNGVFWKINVSCCWYFFYNIMRICIYHTTFHLNFFLQLIFQFFNFPLVSIASSWKQQTISFESVVLTWKTLACSFLQNYYLDQATVKVCLYVLQLQHCFFLEIIVQSRDLIVRYSIFCRSCKVSFSIVPFSFWSLPSKKRGSPILLRASFLKSSLPLQMRSFNSFEKNNCSESGVQSTWGKLSWFANLQWTKIWSRYVSKSTSVFKDTLKTEFFFKRTRTSFLVSMDVSWNQYFLASFLIYAVDIVLFCFFTEKLSICVRRCTQHK